MTALRVLNAARRAGLVAGLAALVSTFAIPALAAPVLTVQQTPMLTWGVVGLDSNNVNTGPNTYLEGARVCNTGDQQATGVRADFVWTSTRAPLTDYINLQNASNKFATPLLVQTTYGVLDPTVPADVAQSVLSPTQCFDFYFNVEITRNTAAWNTSRSFRIDVSASNAATASTPTPREIYVEKLVSQNRNKNIAITGPSSVWVGGVFTYTMTGETATNGYEQIDQHIVFPNTVFQVISSYTTYSVGSPSDSVYSDACGWNPDPTSPTYRSCGGTGKAGGNLSQTYKMKILSLPSGSSTITLNGTIYDYSGSSYHYNSNYDSNPSTWDTTISPTPTRADFAAVDAIRRGSRVVIRWDTARETGNIGFHVWREVNGDSTRITTTPIAGAAFLSRFTVDAPGTGYAWWDEIVDDSQPLYWIEALDIDGSSSWHGPIRTRDASIDERIPDRGARTPLLSDLAGRRDGRRTEGLQNVIGAELPSTDPEAFFASASRTTSIELAGRNAVKITVRRDGWTRVTGSQLSAAGLASGTSSRGLRLFVDGIETPLSVRDGGDGKLDSSDSVSFYGTALDTLSTDGHVYWLLSDSRPGVRTAVSNVKSAASYSASSFPFTVERRDRVNFFAALETENTDQWFGPLISRVFGAATQTLDVRNLDSSGTMAAITVRLQGVSDSVVTKDDHHVRVDVNGSTVGEVVFEGRSNVSRSFDFPASLLRNGANTVTLTALEDVADPINWYADSLVDRVRITYPHTYTADDDWLRFSAPGGSSVRVGGFTTSDVVAVDVTDPLAPVLLTPSASSGLSGFDVTVSTPDGGNRLVVLMAAGIVPSPGSVAANTPSSWSDSRNGADFVILTDRSMMSEANRLATRRTSEGWRVAVIDVEDLYDEMNYGAKDPGAIKAFLQSTQSKWRPAPGYVLLLGDASADPRGYLGFPDRDRVPTHITTTAYSAAASDEWLVDFNNDHVGEIAIGRLPAAGAAEASVMIGKTLQYETTSPQDGWNRRADILAGPNDPPGLNDFIRASDRVASRIPAGFDTKKSYSDLGGPAQAKADLLARWSSGSGMVTYFGHGYASGWGLGYNLFDTTDAWALRNQGRLPVVQAMTCLSGWFYHPAPWFQSMAEALLQNPDGGAVAVWASSGSTTLEYQVPAGEAFLEAFVGARTTLGEASRRGKKAAFDGDIRKSWILFGDPTLVLSSGN